jgi:hypothetical protein
MTYLKTELGRRVLKDRSVPLTPRQRAAFILFDGRNSAEQVLAATSAMGVTREDIDYMVQHGLLASGGTGAAVAAPPAPADAAPVAAALATPMAQDTVPNSLERTPQQRYQDAYPIATRLTASLGLRGFRLNLAVEGALNYEQLRELAPKIRAAVGDTAFVELDRALNG